MIDPDGFRPNVGIIVANTVGEVLWAKRVRQDAWQFPQGGIQFGESPEQAMARELHEELGLSTTDVEVIGCTTEWLSYRLPEHYVRRSHKGRVCIGQRQKWFLLRLVGPEHHVRFDASSEPEFDGWRWVDWWHPLTEVVEFKREVYEAALRELGPLIGRNPQDLASARGV